MPMKDESAQLMRPKETETMSHNETPEQAFAQAWVAAQAILRNPDRTKTADVYKKGAQAKSFSYNYAPLDAIIDLFRETFTASGFGFAQFVEHEGEDYWLVTRIMHCRGQYRDFHWPLIGLDFDDPQAAGKAETYARRYGLMSAMGVMPTDEDDDAADLPSRGRTGTVRDRVKRGDRKARDEDEEEAPAKAKATPRAKAKTSAEKKEAAVNKSKDAEDAKKKWLSGIMDRDDWSLYDEMNSDLDRVASALTFCIGAASEKAHLDKWVGDNAEWIDNMDPGVKDPLLTYAYEKYQQKFGVPEPEKEELSHWFASEDDEAGEDDTEGQ